MWKVVRSIQKCRLEDLCGYNLQWFAGFSLKKKVERNHTKTVTVFFRENRARTSLGDPIEVGAVRKAGFVQGPCATGRSDAWTWTGSNQRAPTRTIADS